MIEVLQKILGSPRVAALVTIQDRHAGAETEDVMANYNFEWKGDKKKNWARECFRYQVLYAQQILYDVSRSGSHPDDEVVRHEKLRSDWDRFQVGVRVALVYLVGQLDWQLNHAFRELWRWRRDLLHAIIEGMLQPPEPM